MRILILTHYYPPEVGAPQTRLSALAAGLAAAGLETTIHTTYPHYPDGHIKSPYRNRLRHVEREGEVTVVRSAVIPGPNRGMMRRLANHASFGVGAIATSSTTGAADVVVAETPPLFLATAAIPYAQLKRAALVLNVSDLWPDSAVELGAIHSQSAIRLARGLERRCYRSAVAIVCPTRGIVERLEGREDTAGKVRRIAPAVDLSMFDGAPSLRNGPLRVLYAGTLGLAQGVGTLLDAAARLDPGTAEFVIAGDGAEGDALRHRAAALSNVRMLGPVPHLEVPKLLQDADTVVVTLRDRPLFSGALPTKMLEAMAAARPLVISASGEPARFVEESRGGVAVPPENPEALSQALLDLAADPERAARLGAAGRRFAEAGFGRDRFVAEWLDLLRSDAVAQHG